MRRSEIYWADLGPATGRRPAKRRPVLVIQSDPYNEPVGHRAHCGDHFQHRPRDHASNVFLPAAATGLPRDSVVNVTALVTLNKTDLTEWAGQLRPNLMHDVDHGLRRVLAL